MEGLKMDCQVAIIVNPNAIQEGYENRPSDGWCPRHLKMHATALWDENDTHDYYDKQKQKPPSRIHVSMVEGFPSSHNTRLKINIVMSTIEVQLCPLADFVASPVR